MSRSPGFAAASAVPRDGGLSSRWVWAVVVAIACAWFLTLDARHLLRSDEGRYAEIAREMLASGDWVTIRYNGLKYFEKPPLHLWATAIAFDAFGIGEWQARLWVAICGAIGMLVTMLAARRWFGARVGLFTGLVLLASPVWNIASHFNSLDMSVSGSLACVLAGFVLAQHPLASPRARRGWMLFAWAAIGVAVLTKGLIGIVLPGLALVVYSVAAGDWAVWRRLHLVVGAALMLAIVAPWFVLVSVRNPEFAQFFFVHEHWQRYTSSVHHRVEPFWYFVPQLAGGFLPWVALSPRIAGLLRQQTRRGGFNPVVLMAAWAGSIFVFFSLSGSKLPGYIVPIYPALAVLAALALDRLDAAAWRRALLAMLALAVLGLLASPLVNRLGSPTTPNVLYRAYMPWLAAACAIVVAGVLGAWWLNRSGRLLAAIGAYSLSLFAATTVGLLGHETLGRSSSGIDLLAPMRAVLTDQMPIYSVRLLDHTLPFYLGRTITLVEAADELEFGTVQEPQKWVPTMARFREVWSAGPRAVAMMSRATFDALKREQLPMFPLAEDPRRVVVTNFSRGSP